VQVELANVLDALWAEKTKSQDLEKELKETKEKAKAYYTDRQKYKIRLREAHAAYQLLKGSYLKLQERMHGATAAPQGPSDEPEGVSPHHPSLPPSVIDVGVEEEEDLFAVVPATEGEERWETEVSMKPTALSRAPIVCAPQIHPEDLEGKPPLAKLSELERDQFNAIQTRPSTTVTENSPGTVGGRLVGRVAPNPEAEIPSLHRTEMEGGMARGGKQMSGVAPLVSSTVAEKSQWKEAVRHSGFDNDLHNTAKLVGTGRDLPSAPQPLLGQGQHVSSRKGRQGFKYQEVVRQHEARSRLPAFDCSDCRRFYVALERSGSLSAALAAGLTIPQCGHPAEQKTITDGGGGEHHRTRFNLIDGASRHRFHDGAPPLTPADYWDISFL